MPNRGMHRTQVASPLGSAASAKALLVVDEFTDRMASLQARLHLPEYAAGHKSYGPSWFIPNRS